MRLVPSNSLRGLDFDGRAKLCDFDASQDKLSFEGMGIEDMKVDVVDLDNSGALDVMFTAIDAPDWGAVVLVDVGRLDTEDILVETEGVA